MGNLSRALGDLRYKQNKDVPAAEQIVTAFPEVREVEIKAGEDEFLVIGCDGIWEKCENEDAVEFVRMRLTAEKSAPSSLSQVCAEICDRGLCPTMDGSDPAFDGKG